ncbi:MAG: primosomal protein N' [Pelagibacteraceae bacterium TMED216]|nr:MAG: primosomal protein N' [Pelagibacteraceae bacterium TMED216]
MQIPILLPKIFNYPLTYKSDKKNKLRIGDFVKVPFGKSTEIGIVWDKIEKPQKKIKIKYVSEKIENFNLKKSLVEYINWFSNYNLSSKGLVLKMSIGGTKKYEKISDQEYKKNKIKKKNYSLNSDQESSLNYISKFDNKFSVTVLQGVTGSGKTLVYFERIKRILEKDKQVLILMPEIFLTKQFQKRFSEFFGYEPYLWHSKITPKNKKIIWHGIINDKIKIIIGARSSLLLPFKNLGLIIVDEEHDASYKQEDGIIYNARDMAIARASIEKIPINLVTSIPSIETFNNIQNKKYNYTFLENRYKEYPFPKAKIINLNVKTKEKRIIASETYALIDDYLKSKNQVLFFVNRRGYSPFLVCKNCGYKHTCPNCSIFLTYHKIINKAVCHHCGYKNKIIKDCKNNNKKCDFLMYGPGVEKVYDELKKSYPKKKIKIFSSDYLSLKKNKTIIKEIEKNEIDILIGTQMISKGFNFPHLNCIVVVDADFSGKGYDLRTTEKNIQLYNQLSGRAGRNSSKSLIIYQTITPSHQTLINIMENKFDQFLIDELNLRKKNNLPPFKKLIALIVSSHSKENSFRGAQEIKNNLVNSNNLEIYGPIDSPLFKIKNRYRTRLLIKSKNQDLPQISLSKSLKRLKISNKIKLTVDVDPINFA